MKPFTPRTLIEPFKIKMVEPLPRPSLRQRGEALRRARFNLFGLKAGEVRIDLMTDSGTSAMSQGQWAGMMLGDESYAGGRSFSRFQHAIQEVTGLAHIIPCHQGRAAERMLFSLVGGEGKAVPGNTHFDTTRANIESSRAQALDFVIPEGLDPSSEHPFKGNVDLDRLGAWLVDNHQRVPLFVLTVTNNSGGGQPVSLANIRGLRSLLDEYRIPLFLDAARFAENAYFIKLREPGQGDRTPKEIAREMFGLADGAMMSMKKDAFGNIGGFLALNGDELAQRCRNLLIIGEGFPTYGGLAGRDLEALAVGLTEVLDEHYLEYRIASTAYLWRHLDEAGVPLLRPAGGHAVYLDGQAFLPHIDPAQLPGQALSVALYQTAGIRSVEIGTVMFGKTKPATGLQSPASMDLVRLAIPRRVYTQSHIDYVVEGVNHVFRERETIGGYRLIDEPPALRHFTCGFEPLGWDPLA